MTTVVVQFSTAGADTVTVGAVMFCVTVVDADAVQPLAELVPTTVNVPGALKVAAAVVWPFDQT